MKKPLLDGLVFLVIGLLGLFVLDLPLTNHQSVILLSPEGTHLSAAYYPVSVPAGVLVLEGFGADQHMLRSLVRDLTASGLHVFTFDYSGHGSSPGALGYDNASTDRLAGQVQSAMKEFMQLSGLQADQIVWMGHSLGARVALQSSVLGPLAPSRLVLLGAQVNLGTNAQSEFFTGTTDRDLPWVQSLGSDNPSPLLLSGCAILPPDYEWRQVYPPSLSYEWNVVPAQDLHKVSGINPAAMPALGACAIRLQGPRKCIVFSRYTEEAAKRLHAGDGIDLHAHEMKHCEGFEHNGITGGSVEDKFGWLDSYTERDFRELLGDIQGAAFEDNYANDAHRVNTIRGLLQNFMENANERRIRA